jgi:DNA-binding MarR family transcriptional regulator
LRFAIKAIAQYIAQHIAYNWVLTMNQEEKFRQSLTVNKAFMSKRLFDLHLLIQKQAVEIYQAKGMIFPITVSSTILFIASVNGATLTQSAKALGLPHQLIAQRMKILLKLKLVTSSPDSNDKRRTLYKLTKVGKEQLVLLDGYCSEAAIAFNDLSTELELDLHQVISQACEALEAKTFAQRFPSNEGQK